MTFIERYKLLKLVEKLQAEDLVRKKRENKEIKYFLPNIKLNHE